MWAFLSGQGCVLGCWRSHAPTLLLSRKTPHPCYNKGPRIISVCYALGIGAQWRGFGVKRGKSRLDFMSICPALVKNNGHFKPRSCGCISACSSNLPHAQTLRFSPVLLKPWCLFTCVSQKWCLVGVWGFKWLTVFKLDHTDVVFQKFHNTAGLTLRQSILELKNMTLKHL